MKELKKYFEANKDRFLDELLELLRIPSVSADPKYKGDVRRMAEATAQHLRNVGADSVEICETDGHPIVYAEKMVNPKAPTVLVYGHYDVQPPDPLDLWDSPPFEPVVKKTKLHPQGAIFARGACDDKGQFFIHVKAFEMMLKNNVLPCNVKFMIEGEEEVGSKNLEKFCKDNKKKLACNVVLISDTSVIANDTPSLTVGLRGLCYMEVEVTGPNKDLHSGVYGGAVANPVNVLCQMIASLHDSKRHVTVKGFYDDVKKVSAKERKMMNEAPYDEKQYMKDLGVNELMGEKGYTTIERTGIRPTLDVNGIWGGYTGEGAKTVLPSKAFAKISMRLVPDQDPKKIEKLFQKHFESLAPKSVKVRVTAHHGGWPVVVPTNSVEYKASEKAMELAYGKKPLPQRGGGSIPIVAMFDQVLGAKSVLMGFGLDSDDIHSPNEHYGLFNYYKGIETIPYFYKFYSEMKKKK
ncbi:MAG: dipeptidase [Haliscomenobacteraceae bacterium CHB4]|nr:Succinyl-diaminopimelate desuccinylase [Saprospiraceae bacterium]MCE7925450.1 dipeptidase [Haliscomenobacteraceae bacterium CHB4]